MRPIKVPKYLYDIWRMSNSQMTEYIQSQYSNLYRGKPDVSIVIPAYNEEKNILPTLTSIVKNKSKYSVEVIVVNNNSKDNTESIVRATGVKCVNEYTQGYVPARTAGLKAATSIYVINADADTLYPENWIDLMIDPLVNLPNTALTYGRFAFIPTNGTSRFVYFLYESIADILRWYKKRFKEPAMNVYGCNSAFRREECISVNYYDHPPGAGEDGWLAVKLRDNGFGKLVAVPASIAWTVDRHLQKDGGLIKAFFMRIRQAIFGK